MITHYDMMTGEVITGDCEEEIPNDLPATVPALRLMTVDEATALEQRQTLSRTACAMPPPSWDLYVD